MKSYFKILLINLICVILCAACGENIYPVSNSEAEMNGYVAPKAGNYDSQDVAVVVNINTTEKLITFMTTYIGKKYTLYYDGATVFEDKYGTGISILQLNPGDLVDVSFLKTWKRLDRLKLASGQFAFKNTSDYIFANDGKHVMIAGQQYTLDKNVSVVSDEGSMKLIDINPVDVLSFVGIDHIIYSIVVDRGHGYLRLVNDSYFVGGWIEVTQKQICKIEEDMIIAVPVGTYTVTVSNAGSSGQETITVEKGKEYELDVSGWQAEAKYGDIVFAVTPSNARVYIDGNPVDVKQPVNLEYGIHQMIVVCDGYQTISEYIKVVNDSASIDINMEPKETGVSTNNAEGVSDNQSVSFNIINPPDNEDEDNQDNNNNTDNDSSTSNNSSQSSTSENSSNNNSTSSNSASNNSANNEDTISTSTTYKVHIDAPSGVEVYVDGAYVGISPVSFNKKEGNVVVILRKNGYETRSYTLNLDSEKKDVNYSFSELEKL